MTSKILNINIIEQYLFSKEKDHFLKNNIKQDATTQEILQLIHNLHQ